MLKRFLNAFSVWICLPLALASAGDIALAETTVRNDFGTIEAIEIFRVSDNQPVNLRVGDRVRVENNRIYRM